MLNLTVMGSKNLVHLPAGLFCHLLIFYTFVFTNPAAGLRDRTNVCVGGIIGIEVAPLLTNL